MPKDEEFLAHYGVKHRSGRYAYGSGEIPFQHEPWFTWGEQHKELISQNLPDSKIAKALGISSQDLRARRSIYKNEMYKQNVLEAKKLKEEGLSNYKIAEKLGQTEGTIRNYFKNEDKNKNLQNDETYNTLKKSVDENRYIDIGAGVPETMGIPETQLDVAVNKLTLTNDYKVLYFEIPQAGTTKKTSMKILVKNDEHKTTKDLYKEASNNLNKVKMPVEPDIDRSQKQYQSIEYPTSLDSKRLQILYAEDGGTKKDGLIELRRGVDDIALPEGTDYAQVRILVNDKYYIKGMAAYSDNLPKGVDVRFNSNKPKEKGLENALKPIKDINEREDPKNPFGASLTAEQQNYYIDKKTGEKKLSIVAPIKEEDYWSDYSKSIASQFLSKQTPKLAKDQLDIDYIRRRDTFDEIKNINNPVVRNYILNNFAGSCDSAAVELKAAALPRQSTCVLLPVNSLKPNEVYAPNYKEGEEVILVRYPFAGNFESPKLIVNNSNIEAKSFMNNARDAIGINQTTAKQLSGADFDGDTALVIPTNGINGLRFQKAIKELEEFDPEKEYSEVKGMKYLTKETTQNEMGRISNLITDMTIAGASESEIVRAVKYSMIVIDAAKHKYNYTKAYKDLDIAELHKKYQGKSNAGAQTLISRSSGDYRIPEIDRNKRKIDPETGELSYLETGRTYHKWEPKRDYIYDENGKRIKGDNGKYLTKEVKDENGKIIREVVRDKDGNPKEFEAQTLTTKMGAVKDARELIGINDTEIEHVYASYANRCKALANEARKEALKNDATTEYVYSKSASETYANEVSSLMSKLNYVAKNAPLERQAQILTNFSVKQRRNEQTDMSKDELKKIQRRTLSRYRTETGAKGRFVTVTPKEWEAMMMGAVKKNALQRILSKMKAEDIDKLVMTKDKFKSLTNVQISRIKLMQNQGATWAEIADAFDISVSTAQKAVKGEL